MLSLFSGSCAAQEETYGSAQEGLELWSALNEAYPQENGFTGDFYGIDGYGGEEPASIPLSLAFPVADMNGDRAADLLILNISTDQQTNTPNSEISALSGADGSTIWQRDYSNALAFASSAGDLNGDGQNDVMLNVIIGVMDSLPYSNVSALDGSSGMELWSNSHLLAATLAYPARDLTGDNATDLVAHLFGIDSLNGSLVTKISLLNGVDGRELSSRIFPGAIALEYPGGNFTDDETQDGLRGVYEIGVDGDNITTAIEAVDGADRTELWNMTYAGLAVALPSQDFTGDGLDDLLTYLISNINTTNTTDTGGIELAMIRGTDGMMLWSRSFGSSLPVAFAGPDLTGDGVRDLIIYSLGDSDEEGGIEVMAVEGDDGVLLWSKSGLIVMPQ